MVLLGDIADKVIFAYQHHIPYSDALIASYPMTLPGSAANMFGTGGTVPWHVPQDKKAIPPLPRQLWRASLPKGGLVSLVPCSRPPAKCPKGTGKEKTDPQAENRISAETETSAISTASPALSVPSVPNRTLGPAPSLSVTQQEQEIDADMPSFSHSIR
jgi:hypothetical protein